MSKAVLGARDLSMLGSRSVGRHLALLCAALALPALLLLGALTWLAADQQRQRAATQVEDVAVSAIAALDREMAGYESTLEALATFPSFDRGDHRTFYSRAIRVARQSGVVITLRDREGRQLLSTAAPYGRPLPRFVTSVDRLVLADRRPAVSDLELKEPGRGAFTIVVPVVRDGRADELLSATIPAEQLVRVLRETLPSTIYAASFSDRTGRVVARTRDQREWVGKPITEPLKKAARGLAKGTWIGPSHEGEPLLGGFARSQRSGWLAAIGAHRGVLAVPASNLARVMVAGGIFLTVLSVLFAILFARRIVGPLEQLAGQAGDLAEGRPVAPVQTSLAEVDAVSASLAGAADAIDQRDKALRSANSRLEAVNSELEAEVARRTREVEETAALLFQAQKMESLGRLTGGVAHDFNNLLTPIMSGLDLLRRQHDDPRSRRLIDGALASAERAAALVKHLLSFARRQELTPQPVRCASLLEEMRDLLERSLGARIALTVDVPADLPPAFADPNQLELALLNLAVNARDAMPEGGALAIVAREIRVEPGEVVGLTPGRYLRFRVKDTGVGMDEETLKRAVEPFFTTKGVGKGTGLGLSMVHGLAAQLGGAFQLRSRLGQGTTALLWLPIAHELAGEVLERNEEATAGICRAAILLVDDDPFVRGVEAEGLRELGYEVAEADSGEQALRMIEDGMSCDLLITDQTMSGMTGTELAVAVRQIHPNLPVLLATGHAEVSEPGMEILAKPFRHAELARQVSRLLARAEV